MLEGSDEDDSYDSEMDDGAGGEYDGGGNDVTRNVAL